MALAQFPGVPGGPELLIVLAATLLLFGPVVLAVVALLRYFDRDGRGEGDDVRVAEFEARVAELERRVEDGRRTGAGADDSDAIGSGADDSDAISSGADGSDGDD
ncbi:preprotein translocase subunit TatA [Halegenticoccus soli]|uniref:preprotein translocase subunit TatA n=1 Tax=Halegenticoccus soli TaxID=1985678 RepID=UPI0018EA4E0B|nr:preprotein translocase subunit TatA [Halegenticoccus soli]